MQTADRAGSFSDRVVVLFLTQVFSAGFGIVNGILLARLLGPAAKGEYYLIVLLPATAVVILQLGVPQAFGFYAARGQTAGILRQTYLLTASLSLVALLGLAIVLPLAGSDALAGASPILILAAFAALPPALHVTYTTAIVMARNGVRWYSGVNIVFSIATTILLVAVLGGLGASVPTAIAVYVISVAIQAIGFAIGARRVCAAVEKPRRTSYRELFRYGFAYFPASLASFFSYRVDAFLIAILVADASAPLGYYSMAVGLAEMVFFFPRAVATLFFPHVAGSAREDVDRHVALVSRVTLLVTGAFAVLLVPASAVMIAVVLPAFGPSLLPLVVLLPGVVTLSATNVVSPYLRGTGRPGIVSQVTLVALAVNVVCNLVLIPQFGIVGASAASLVSYTLTSVLLTAIAARSIGIPILDFWLPRVSDIGYLATATAGVVRRIADRRRGVADHP